MTQCFEHAVSTTNVFQSSGIFQGSVKTAKGFCWVHNIPIEIPDDSLLPLDIG